MDPCLRVQMHFHLAQLPTRQKPKYSRLSSLRAKDRSSEGSALAAMDHPGFPNGEEQLRAAVHTS